MDVSEGQECSACGRPSIQDDARFCAGCGAPIAARPRPRRRREGLAASGPPTVLPAAVREPESAQDALTRQGPRVDTSRAGLKRSTSGFRRSTGPLAAVAPAPLAVAEPQPPAEPDLDLAHARYEDVHPEPHDAHNDVIAAAPSYDAFDDDDLLAASGLERTRRNRVLGSVAVVAAAVVMLALTI